MKYSSVVGKSVQQLEEEMLLGVKKLNNHQKDLMILALSVIIMIMMAILWNFHQEITQLHTTIYEVEKKNDTLTKEYATLAKGNNVMSMQMENKTSLKETKDVFYYEIKSGDSFSTISKHYYGTEALAVQLAKLNGLESQQLKLGQIVKVPKKLDQRSLYE